MHVMEVRRRENRMSRGGRGNILSQEAKAVNKEKELACQEEEMEPEAYLHEFSEKH